MRKIFFVAAAALVLMFSGCKGCKEKNCNDATNPQCPNYDPCLKYQGLSADFTIQESLTNSFSTWEPETDSALSFNKVRFEPKSQDLDSVKWLIGTEVITDRVFYRRYFTHWQSIPVTLIAYYKSHMACKPGSTGIDTMTKSFYSVGTLEEAPISGVFTGSNTDAPADTFTIQINDTTLAIPHDPLSAFPYARTGCIQGLPKGAADVDVNGQDQILYGALHLFIGGAPDPDLGVPRTNYGLRAKGTFKGGVLTIDYSYEQSGLTNFLTGSHLTNVNNVSKTFIGHKIRQY